MIILLVGFGSIGQRHYKILKKLKFLKSTYVLSKQKLPPNIQKCSDLSEVRKINPDYVIIASPTNLHYQQLNYINNVLKIRKFWLKNQFFIA